MRTIAISEDVLEIALELSDIKQRYEALSMDVFQAYEVLKSEYKGKSTDNIETYSIKHVEHLARLESLYSLMMQEITQTLQDFYETDEALARAVANAMQKDGA